MCIIRVSAQELRVDSVADNSFSGLKNGMNGNASYFYFLSTSGDKNQTEIQVRYSLQQFTELKQFKVSIPKTSFIQSSAALDLGFVFYLADKSQHTRTVMIVDFSGKVINKKTEDGVDDKLLAPNAYVYINGIMPSGILLVTRSNNDKDVYTVSKLNMELKEDWVKEIKPESRGIVDIIGVNITMDKAHVLSREYVGGKQPVYKAALTSYFCENGDVIAHNLIKDGNDYCVPVFLNCKDMMSFTAGLYYPEGKYKPGGAAGILIQHFTESGTVERSVKIPMSKLNSFLPDAAIEAMSKNGLLAVVDAFQNERSALSVVCEVVDNVYIESAKESNVMVSDLMVINTDIENNLEKVQLVRNVKPLNVIFKGSMATGNTLALTEWLKNNDLMHYRFNAEGAGALHVAYIANADTERIKAVFVPAMNASKDLEREPVLLRLPEIERKLKWKNTITIDDASLKSVKYADWKKINIVHGIGSTIRVINYLPPQLVMAQEHTF